MPDSCPQVLIADDREENRYVLSRVLERAGYHCLQTGTGYGALEIAQTLPDVVILDVRLPDISGYEVCKRIKGDPRTASISVLQISASFVSSDDRVRALEGGADGYLTHPIDRMVLIATVRALLRLRAAEGAARKAAQQWQSTFDALREGLALIDAYGRMIRWNSAFAEICRPKCQPEAGEDAAVFLECVLGTSEPLHQNGEHYRAEFAIAKKTVELSVIPFESESTQREKIVILNDITDRKLADYALLTAEKLAATGNLANAIAHEINNPLEALTNLLYLAESSSSLDLTREFLARASSELARISRITKQSLAFHRDSQHPIPIDLSSLVAEVVEMLARSAASSLVHLIYDCPAPINICGFPGQLTQIFRNLICNALEASTPGSNVVIRIKVIHRNGSEGARVTVHDRGSGISKEIQEEVYDPFFTTKDLKGSGLGLWVSRSLVLKHHGTIRFRSSSRPGVSGTTFEVFLPIGNLTSRNASEEDVKRDVRTSLRTAG